MKESATTRVKSRQIERCLDRDFFTLTKSLCEEVNKFPKAILFAWTRAQNVCFLILFLHRLAAAFLTHYL